MPELPPKELVAALERLGLATAGQVAGVARQVGRLAGELPQFDSVWLDALAQARILTPFQVAELIAGRGESLRIGPFLLCERLPHPYYVATYRAKNVDSSETVRLAVVDNPGPRADAILRELESLVGIKSGGRRAEGGRRELDARHPKSKRAGSSTSSGSPAPALTLTLSRRERGQTAVPLPSSLSLLLSPLSHAGLDGRCLFAAAPWIDGRTAAEWMVHHGRFPPEVVLEIARAMLAELVELEKDGICHGDVSLASLLLTDAGDAVLILPGLRGILRPEEGYAHADLLPEAFDSLPPERITAGTPPNAASDIYGCGCVWWQMLCGRPPLAGGTSLAKLRAAQAGEICDVRRYAPDVPAPLAAAISACVQREPSRRPDSMTRLAAMLGSPTRNGKEALADCLARAGRPTVRWTTTVRKVRRSNRTPLWLAGAACLLAAMVAIFWPAWHVGTKQWSVVSGQWSVGSKSEIRNPKSEIFPPSALRPPPSSPVVPAAYQQPVQPPEDFVLPAGNPLAVGVA